MSGVLGIFEQREDLLKAVKEARTENLGPLEAFSPVLDEDLIEAVSPGKSPVRRLTLLGGVTGGICGLVLTIWTTAQWPLLITGGKPLISIPPFLVIAFELTILFGALGTVSGFLYWSIWARHRRPLPYDTRFTQDHFGLWIECPSVDTEQVAKFLKERGATEWEIR
jgi:hypothetical protein